jgi:hypothetical protein
LRFHAHRARSQGCQWQTPTNEVFIHGNLELTSPNVCLGGNALGVARLEAAAALGPPPSGRRRQCAAAADFPELSRFHKDGEV